MKAEIQFQLRTEVCFVDSGYNACIIGAVSIIASWVSEYPTP